MKKLGILYIVIISFGLFSCGKGSGAGELIGVRTKAVKQEIPYGMVYIPSGTFVMGQVDQDITISQFPQNKQVTISAFYMDETEISNTEYKQFVNWVRDSIAIKKLGSKVDQKKYFLTPKTKGTTARSTNKYINWKAVNGKKGIWADKKISDALEKAMYLSLIHI